MISSKYIFFRIFFLNPTKMARFGLNCKRGKMACKFLLYSAQFSSKIGWKILSKKKFLDTCAVPCCLGLGCQIAIFIQKMRAKKGIFSKSSFYTKMFSDPKYSFSVCQFFFCCLKKS